jgi:dephospho-CoA kinase
VSCIAVGISGEVAAGKTTAGKALRDVGFGYTRISKVIDAVLAERGLPPTRKNHQNVGLELHNDKGQAWLCEQAINLVEANTRALVLDGLRWPEDVAYMRERYGKTFLHIHVSAREAERERRFERMSKGIAYQDVTSHPVEQHVAALAQRADRVLTNNGRTNEFLVDVLGSVLERVVHAG